ncbi:hypothetical protein MKW94_002956, partial [Papaver nudicaule]|nr:hypothetical protein [Papaver nudicaule]
RSRNERNRPNFRAESIEVKRSEETPPPPKVSIEAPPVKQILEKTPEPAKKSPRSDTHFCHVYLSKLDISVDLTHPQIYNQCMSLCEIEENPMSDNNSKHAHLKEFEESRLKLSNTTLNASLFPILKDTVLQRAMLLYRKRGEVTQTKQLPFSSLSGSELESAPSCNHGKAEMCLSLSEQKPETLPTTTDEAVQIYPPSAQEIPIESTVAEIVAEEPNLDQIKVEEPVSVEMMVEEPILAEEMGEQPISFEMAVEEPVLTQTMVQETVPAQLLDDELVPSQMMVDEPVPAQMVFEEPIPAQMMVEEPVSTPMMVEEPVSTPMMVEEPVSSPMMVEEPVPAHMMVEEPVPAHMLVEETGSSQQVVGDSVPTTDYEESEEPIAFHREVVNLVAVEDAITISSDSEGDGGAAAEHIKSVHGPRYDELGYTNEVCEGLTPESNECRSVNLRIHSSESTH